MQHVYREYIFMEMIMPPLFVVTLICIYIYIFCGRGVMFSLSLGKRVKSVFFSENNNTDIFT